MATTYKITAPDGQTYRITGSGTQEEALAHFQSTWRPSDNAAAAASTAAKSTDRATKENTPIGEDTLLNRAKRTGLGLAQGAIADPLVALGQLTPSETIRNLANQQQDWYTRKRAELGGEGVDLSRISGNVAGTLLPMGLLGKGAQAANAATKAATVPGRLASGIGTGAKAGAIGAAINPLESQAAEGSYLGTLGNKAQQVGLGIGSGAVLGGVLSPFSKSLAAQQAQNVANKPIDQLSRSELLLKAESELPGLSKELSPYTKAGATKLEQKLTSSAILGSAAEKSLQRQQWGFQRAIMDKALEPAGIKIDAAKSGRGVIKEAKEKLGKEYDAILPKLSLNESGLKTKIETDLAGELKYLSEPLRKKFDNELNRGLFDHFKDKGGKPITSITGDQWKKHFSSHHEKVIKKLEGGTVDEQTIARLLKDAWKVSRNDLVDASGKNQGLLDRLNKTDQAYANYKILSEASKQNAGGLGQFTTTQALQQIRKRNPNQFEQGTAFMQPQLELAHRIIGDKLPTSGTAERLGLLPELAIMTGTGGLGAIPHAIAATPYVARGITESFPKTFGALSKVSQATGKGLGTSLDAAHKVSPAVSRYLTMPSSELPSEEGHRRGGLMRYATGGVVNNYLDQKVAEATLARLNATPPPMPQPMPQPMSRGGLAGFSPIDQILNETFGV